MNNLSLPLILLLALLLFFSFPCESANDVIEETCQKTPYLPLCVSTLRSDPRRATADPAGLANISLDILLSKANATLREAIKLYMGTGAEPIVYQYYGACIDVYITSVVKLLPNASTELGTGKFSEARGDVTRVVNYAEGCAQQFAGRSDPLVPWTTGVHDFGTVAADIIGSLG